eukprot:366278-Chlamydomonas_euryale.AAC.17
MAAASHMVSYHQCQLFVLLYSSAIFWVHVPVRVGACWRDIEACHVHAGMLADSIDAHIYQGCLLRVCIARKAGVTRVFDTFEETCLRLLMSADLIDLGWRRCGTYLYKVGSCKLVALPDLSALLWCKRKAGGQNAGGRLTGKALAYCGLLRDSVKAGHQAFGSHLHHAVLDFACGRSWRGSRQRMRPCVHA